MIGSLIGTHNDTDLPAADVRTPGLGAGPNSPVAAMTGTGAGHLSIANGELTENFDKSHGSAGYISADFDGLCRTLGYKGRVMRSIDNLTVIEHLETTGYLVMPDEPVVVVCVSKM